MSGGFFLSDDDSDDDGRGGEYAGAGEYSDGRGGEYAGAGEYSDDEGQREQYYGYNDDGEDRSDPFQRAPEDVLKKRKMVRASLLSPARHRTSASAAVSASTAPIVNLTGSPGSDNGAPPLEHDDVKGDFIGLYAGNSQACNKKYNKEAKINIFYEVLSLEYSILLGDSPPPQLKAVCTSYRENAKRKSRWKLVDIGGAVY
jgi:hypothetical protein